MFELNGGSFIVLFGINPNYLEFVAKTQFMTSK